MGITLELLRIATQIKNLRCVLRHFSQSERHFLGIFEYWQIFPLLLCDCHFTQGILCCCNALNKEWCPSQHATQKLPNTLRVTHQWSSSRSGDRLLASSCVAMTPTQHYVSNLPAHWPGGDGRWHHAGWRRRSLERSPSPSQSPSVYAVPRIVKKKSSKSLIKTSNYQAIVIMNIWWVLVCNSYIS